VKRYWKIIADNLSKAGLSWGCVSAIDREGRTIWIVARMPMEDVSSYAPEMLTAFLELTNGDT
jgi:hypothetical protein